MTAILKPKLSITSQVAYMKNERGILFNIVSEQEAEEFLRTSNYYFKIKAFEKNYPVVDSGPNAGKYNNLEFAYLQELSTLDMYIRDHVLSLSLAIEHFAKVRLLFDISENNDENGYDIVQLFFSLHPDVKNDILDKERSPYSHNIINKYKNSFAAWNLVEVLSFGQLVDFCDLYYSKYQGTNVKIGNLKITKYLRNAAAHNNCLINDLGRRDPGFKSNKDASGFVATHTDISRRSREKKMDNRFINDFVVMLLVFSQIASTNSKKAQFKSLSDFCNNRLILHKDYFSDNALLVSSYEFAKKVIDSFSAPYV